MRPANLDAFTEMEIDACWGQHSPNDEWLPPEMVRAELRLEPPPIKQCPGDGVAAADSSESMGKGSSAPS